MNDKKTLAALKAAISGRGFVKIDGRIYRISELSSNERGYLLNDQDREEIRALPDLATPHLTVV